LSFRALVKECEKLMLHQKVKVSEGIVTSVAMWGKRAQEGKRRVQRRKGNCNLSPPPNNDDD